jgi:telomerase Cajal body protein 1
MLNPIPTQLFYRIKRLIHIGRPPDLLTPPQASPSADLDTDPESNQTTSPHHHLRAYTTHPLPTPSYATTASPYWTLSAPETTLILTSPANLPIRLLSPFSTQNILATYPLVDAQTEKWIAPHSLLFNSPGQPSPDESLVPSGSLTFLAGSNNAISLFDAAVDGAGPVSSLATVSGGKKSRRGFHGNGVGMRGIVSAMALSADGILAAGTFARGVGLYDARGLGDVVSTWVLGEDSSENDDCKSGNGAGVTQVFWSKCARYLGVVERRSSGIAVWDIRVAGRRLAWLDGRKAQTVQRLGAELGPTLLGEDEGGRGNEGESVYAGGTDGVVRVWNGLGLHEGIVVEDWNWKAHQDAVAGIRVHACGSVVATCSGSRKTDDDYDGDNRIWPGNNGENKHDAETLSELDNSIRVWNLE